MFFISRCAGPSPCIAGRVSLYVPGSRGNSSLGTIESTFFSPFTSIFSRVLAVKTLTNPGFEKIEDYRDMATLTSTGFSALRNTPPVLDARTE